MTDTTRSREIDRRQYLKYVGSGLIVGGVVGVAGGYLAAPPKEVAKEAPTVTKTETKTESKEVTKEVTAVAKTVPIGAVVPLTGGNAVMGQSLHRAITLGEELMENEGGIRAADGTVYLPKVIIEDGADTVDKAISAVHKLIDVDQCKIITIPTSAWCVPAAPILQEKKVVGIGTHTSAKKISEFPDFFRIPASQEIEAQTWGKALYDEGVRSYVHVYLNDDFGISQMTFVKKAFNYFGGQDLAVLPYNAGDTDFSAHLTKIKALKPDAVLFGGNPAERAIFYKQAKELGVKDMHDRGEISMWDHQPMPDESLREGVFIWAVASTEKWQYYRYLEEWEKRYPMKEGEFWADQFWPRWAYDGLTACFEAIRLSETGYTFEGMDKALHNTVDFQGVYFHAKFDENGDNRVVLFKIMKIVNGKQTEYKTNLLAFKAP